MVYVIQFCRQISSRVRMSHPDPALKLSAKLYDIYHCCVYSENSWRWTEELSETCRVSFQEWIWEISASSSFYYKNLPRYTVTWTSKNRFKPSAFWCIVDCFTLTMEALRFPETSVTIYQCTIRTHPRRRESSSPLLWEWHLTAMTP